MATVENNSWNVEGNSAPSYGSVLKELSESARDLIQSEVRLIKLEMSQVGQKVGRHSAQAAIFGGLLALSILPFLAFVVIGLGRLMDDNYWLSSLIVAVVCAAVGGFLAYRAYKKIKDEDLDFTHTKSTLDHEVHAVQARINEIKDAARGDRHDTNQLHH
jgi:uncharacterized membrane protein YqjE